MVFFLNMQEKRSKLLRVDEKTWFFGLILMKIARESVNLWKRKEVMKKSDMDGDFSSRVAEFSQENGLVADGARVLVALSGGADSVALLRWLLAEGADVVAAHCNFHLRCAESDRDEQFVRGLCETLGVPLLVKHFDVKEYMAEKGVSVEMACRELRYEWFGHLLDSEECDVLAVAHHRDDNIETFFINLLRGTGVAGLGGMRPRSGRVVRPFLCVSRRDIEEYLAVLGQEYVTDSTNLVSDVKRNRLRNEVFPVLDEQFGGWRDMAQKTLKNVLESNELYDEGVELMRSIVVDEENGDGEMRIDRDCLLSMKNPSMLLFELIKQKGFAKWQCEDAVKNLDECDAGKVYESGDWELQVERKAVALLKRKEKDCGVYSIDLSKPVELPIRLGLQWHEGADFSKNLVDGSASVAFDESIMECRQIVLRHWREGDRFSPFGLHGTKLISDLFADLKLSAREKDEVWLMEADGTIVWVVGYRSSKHYAVKQGGGRFLVLRVEK